MRCLTLTQPWATLVALGHKRFETRCWSTSYRGLLAIHAAKGFPKDAQRFAAEERALGRLPPQIPFGAVVAVCTMTACMTTEYATGVVLNNMSGGLERRLGDYSPGRYAFRLVGVVALKEPVPCRGALSIWTLPLDVEEEVRQQIAVVP